MYVGEKAYYVDEMDGKCIIRPGTIVEKENGWIGIKSGNQIYMMGEAAEGKTLFPNLEEARKAVPKIEKEYQKKWWMVKEETNE